MMIGTEGELESWRSKKPAVHPEFFLKPVEDSKASQVSGRVVFKDEEWVNIHKRGELGHVTPMPVKMLKKDGNLWPYLANAYEAWRAGLDEPLEGTALKNWPHITPSFMRNCENMGVRTVEDLANLPDGSLRHIGMGAIDLRQKARNWLNASSDVGKTTEQMTALQSENRRLAQMVEEMNKRLKAMEAPAPIAGKVVSSADVSKRGG